MIPIRRLQPPEPTQSISSRLAQLRFNQSASRPPLTPSITSTLISRYLLDQSSALLIDAKVIGLPNSWTVKKRVKEISLSRRQYLLSTLRDSVEYESRSLFNVMSKLILTNSIYIPYLSSLPIHVKIAMLKRSSLSVCLEENVLEALLQKENEEEESEWSDFDLHNLEDDKASLNELLEDWDNLNSSEMLTLPIINFPNNLTNLNLSFSLTTLPFLQKLLLTQSSTSTNNRPPKSNYPFLKTLSLCSTPKIPFNFSLFSILAIITSLQHLSLAAKVYNPQSNTLLSKLATSTPHLISLDLSFNPWLLDLLIFVKWTTQWSSLRKLGLRNRENLTEEEIINLEEMQRLEKERSRLWSIVSGKNERDKKSRSWIDIVV